MFRYFGETAVAFRVERGQKGHNLTPILHFLSPGEQSGHETNSLTFALSAPPVMPCSLSVVCSSVLLTSLGPMIQFWVTLGILNCISTYDEEEGREGGREGGKK